jgi:hypothetical protein
MIRIRKSQINADPDPKHWSNRQATKKFNVSPANCLLSYYPNPSTKEPVTDTRARPHDISSKSKKNAQDYEQNNTECQNLAKQKTDGNERSAKLCRIKCYRTLPDTLGCGQGTFIPDLGTEFFHPGPKRSWIQISIKELKYF